MARPTSVVVQAEVEKDLMACYEKRPEIAYVDSRRGITNLHVTWPPAALGGGEGIGTVALKECGGSRDVARQIGKMAM
eukprot:Skav219593  [mRNA]  locus=scaffold1719:19383:19616:+ [translate_table: standard]